MSEPQTIYEEAAQWEARYEELVESVNWFFVTETTDLYSLLLDIKAVLEKEFTDVHPDIKKAKLLCGVLGL